jgi:prepilin-type N-terminal cleavage/methylation domain-containing protein
LTSSITAKYKKALRTIYVVDSLEETKDHLVPQHGEKYPMRDSEGFSLAELLIVVAIIALIAAIAIPSHLTSRQAADEASATQGCRTIGSAEIAFAATNNQQYTDITSLVSGNS